MSRQRRNGARRKINWDSPGALSIVVQGALLPGNMIETANHCQHWRSLFPHAEIILCISVTDVLVGSVEQGIYTQPRVAARFRHDGHMAAALEVIKDSCDKLILAPPALPLPPIKSDSPKLNNMNFQISAAKSGLAAATGEYVLRIRSDFIFSDRKFLDQYVKDAPLPRGDASIFDQRVMVSWLYTLNPYTCERLPLHISDWFHLGLTRDIRRIWDCPPITLADAVYYRSHSHASGSNVTERLFNIRIAVEQHLMYNCFKADFPELILKYHNDCSSRKHAIDILVDNFVVCDVANANGLFAKYEHDFRDPSKLYHCITADDWRSLVHNRDVDYEVTLSAKISMFENPALTELAEPFPRKYDVHKLHPKDSRRLGDVIVSGGAGGLVCFGPYARVPAGEYIATIETATLTGPGVLALKVTDDYGRHTLAEGKYPFGPVFSGELSIKFDVPPSGADTLEVVCFQEGVRTIAVSGMVIDKVVKNVEPIGVAESNEGDERSEFAEPFPRRYDVLKLIPKDGRQVGDIIVSPVSGGLIFYGPYARVPEGDYIATVKMPTLRGPGFVVLKVTDDEGRLTLAEARYAIAAAGSDELSVFFEVPPPGADGLEVLCLQEGVGSIAVSGVVIDRAERSERPITINHEPPPGISRRFDLQIGRWFSGARYDKLPTE